MKIDLRNRKMMLRALSLAMLTLGIGLPLTAQTAPRDQARGVLPASVFARVDALAVEASRNGVPASPLFNKALEGAAKRVPEPLLLTGLRGYADRLVMTRGAFGHNVTPPVLVAGADALQRGVTVETLRGLGEGGPHSPMAVMVLADLVESGVPSAQALRVLHEAMGQRMDDDMMVNIPHEVHRFMREGHSPWAAADRVWSHMRGGMGGNSMWMGPGGSMGPGVPPGWVPMGGRGHSGGGW
jgi:hypothetical protein